IRWQKSSKKSMKGADRWEDCARIQYAPQPFLHLLRSFAREGQRENIFWRYPQGIYQVFRPPDQRTGFTTTRPGHNQRRSGRLDSSLLKLIVLLLGQRCLRWSPCQRSPQLRSFQLRLPRYYFLLFPQKPRHAIKHSRVGNVTDAGKLVGRDSSRQLELAHPFKRHQEFGHEDIRGQLTLAARIIG